MIQIRNGKRFNIYASGVIDGVTYPNFTDRSLWPALGISEVEEPTPQDPDRFDRVETDDAPYVAYVARPAEQVAAIRWEKIKQLRDSLIEYGGCLVQGHWFHSDVRSKQQQIALVMMGASIPAGLQWKTMDGSFVTMTQALAAELFAAQAAREQAIFATAEAKRRDNSPISDGWPAQYTEAA